MNRIDRTSATLRRPTELVARGLAPAADLAELEKVASRYAVAVTADMAALIDRADPNDPIARQFVPSVAELVTEPGENADPIGDHAHSPVAGIVHRYPDRVLFKLVHVCAVYCRFCFRREMVGPGKATALSQAAYRRALDYVRLHPEIWEVILTGGDPLMLSPRRLAEVMADLAAIDHVRIVRIHTRVPVADPARVSGEMIAALRVEGATTWVALHANHARELTGKARAACAGIIDAGIPMVSQSVLLRGVNDDAATLEALMRAFVECRIKPYYLHHGDLAPGTAHLRTTLAHGQELMRKLRGRVSGLCQPGYVLDIPGGHGKAPVGPNYLSPADSFRMDSNNGNQNCVIVWLIIAATFISILRRRDREMTGGGSAAEPGWRIQMRRLVTIVALVILSSAATAQNGNPGSSTSSANPSRPMPEAPVGHRQPARDQVPSEKNLGNPNDAINREDAALDRKIKSICRGC